MLQLQEILKHRQAIVVVVLVLAGLYLWRQVRRWLRLRRPAQLNPRLAKYGASNGNLTAEQTREAENIVATSSTGDVAGYELVRQIEAVYVDGFRHPEEALLGLKAAAALKGANAVIHVAHSRSPTGRCAASGDAVVVQSVTWVESLDEHEFDGPDPGMDQAGH